MYTKQVANYEIGIFIAILGPSTFILALDSKGQFCFVGKHGDLDRSIPRHQIGTELIDLLLTQLTIRSVAFEKSVNKDQGYFK